MKSADLAKLNVRLEKGLLVEENINSSLLLHGGRDVKRLDMLSLGPGQVSLPYLYKAAYYPVLGQLLS